MKCFVESVTPKPAWAMQHADETVGSCDVVMSYMGENENIQITAWTRDPEKATKWSQTLQRGDLVEVEIAWTPARRAREGVSKAR